MYTTSDVAAQLATDPKHVRRIARKVLPGVASSGRWEFNDDQLEQMRQAIAPKTDSAEWKDGDAEPILEVQHLVRINSQAATGLRNYARFERQDRRMKLLKRINDVL